MQQNTETTPSTAPSTAPATRSRSMRTPLLTAGIIAALGVTSLGMVTATGANASGSSAPAPAQSVSAPTAPRPGTEAPSTSPLPSTTPTANPCAEFRPGKPLPASAFEGSYVTIQRETTSRTGKQAKVAVGIKTSPLAAQCGVRKGDRIVGTSSTPSAFELSDHTRTTGTLVLMNTVRVNGAAGVPNPACYGGVAEACSDPSPTYALKSSGTEGASIDKISVPLSVTVPGYGTTNLYVNGGTPSASVSVKPLV